MNNGASHTTINIYDAALKISSLGDIEPRKGVDTTLVSDKSLGLGGAILEAVLTKFNI